MHQTDRGSIGNNVALHIYIDLNDNYPKKTHTHTQSYVCMKRRILFELECVCLADVTKRFDILCVGISIRNHLRLPCPHFFVLLISLKAYTFYAMIVVCLSI